MGNSLALDKISTESIDTSILPVFKSRFTLPIALFTTLPVIFKTDSGLDFSNNGKNLLLFSMTH